MKKHILFLISFYKKFVSPQVFKLLGHGCRFVPTCSDYSHKAIKIHGVKVGIILSLKRIANCHPLSKRAFFDPVPRRLTI